MRVLALNNHGQVRGGSEVYFHALNRLLAEHGHPVQTFVADGVSGPEPIDTARPRLTKLLRYFYSPVARDRLRGVLSRQPFDLAHLHIYYGQLTGAVLSPLRERGLPVVQTVHEYKLVCPVATLHRGGRHCGACSGGRYWRAALNRCNRGSLVRSVITGMEAYATRALGALSHVDRFVAVSDYVREQLIRGGVAPARVVTVHNFVDARPIAPANDRGRHVLYFGRMERVKGIFTLLTAASMLPGIPFLFVGEGNARAELQQTMRRMNLRNVEWRGFLSGQALHQVIRESLCTVLPSEWPEPFGLTLLETFAHGRPVVAARSGGIPEVISEGEDGLLFPAGDAEALAHAIARLDGSPADAQAMGRAGRYKVETRFGPARHYQDLMAVYETVRQEGP